MLSLTEVLKKASVDKKALEGEALEIAEDLKMVEYDLISGKGYLSKISSKYLLPKIDSCLQISYRFDQVI